MGPPQVREISARSVATMRQGFGVPGEITINPYRGCAFGCSYCYARKFVHDDREKRLSWGNWVEVKANAVDALARESHKLFDRAVFVGSATDPYQPLELKHGLTRALLEVLLFAHPKKVHLQTRSPHVVRDIPLLQRFGETLTVGISIPTDSDVVRRAFEPRAPSIARRIATGKALREAGLNVCASVAPLLPGTPRRLAQLLVPAFERAWVGTINFYGDEGEARAIYAAKGWDLYLRLAHAAQVKAALRDAGLLPDKPPEALSQDRMSDG